jgi:hypothetical protein
MVAKYQITVEGVKLGALVPYAEKLTEIAKNNIFIPEKVKEQYASHGVDQEKLTADTFYVSSERILHRAISEEADWGVERPEVQDVQELSREYPQDVFYYVKVAGFQGIAEVEQLENFYRARIQDGDITAVYEAEPVTWTSRF